MAIGTSNFDRLTRAYPGEVKYGDCTPPLSELVSDAYQARNPESEADDRVTRRLADRLHRLHKIQAEADAQLEQLAGRSFGEPPQGCGTSKGTDMKAAGRFGDLEQALDVAISQAENLMMRATALNGRI